MPRAPHAPRGVGGAAAAQRYQALVAEHAGFDVDTSTLWEWAVADTANRWDLNPADVNVIARRYPEVGQREDRVTRPPLLQTRGAPAERGSTTLPSWSRTQPGLCSRRAWDARGDGIGRHRGGSAWCVAEWG